MPVTAPATDPSPGGDGAVPPPGACPACGGPLARWRSVATSDPSLPGRFDLPRCPRCGTAVTAGAPPSFDEAHDGGSYATRRPRGSGLAAPLLRAFDRQRLALVARHLATAPRPGATGGAPGPEAPRLLDVGAGRGRFVATARAAGWRAEGIEPSARGVEAAAASYGVALTRAGIDDAAIEPGSFDAATLWHVLEHLHDPRAAVERLGGWLRPGGLLLIGVPNLRSLQARVGGPRWFHLDVPRHRTHFTPDGLRHLVQDAGLEVVAVHQVLLEHNPFGLWQSAVNRLSGTTSYLYYLLKRADRPRAWPLAATLLALPLLPLAAAVEALAGALGRGGTMALVARRPAGD